MGAASPRPAIHGEEDPSTRFSARKRGRPPSHELAVTWTAWPAVEANLESWVSSGRPGEGTAVPVMIAEMVRGRTTLRGTGSRRRVGSMKSRLGLVTGAWRSTTYRVVGRLRERGRLVGRQLHGRAERDARDGHAADPGTQRTEEGLPGGRSHGIDGDGQVPGVPGGHDQGDGGVPVRHGPWTVPAVGGDRHPADARAEGAVVEGSDGDHEQAVWHDRR